jgi:hypothetical protein
MALRPGKRCVIDPICATSDRARRGYMFMVAAARPELNVYVLYASILDAPSCYAGFTEVSSDAIVVIDDDPSDISDERDRWMLMFIEAIKRGDPRIMAEVEKGLRKNQEARTYGFTSTTPTARVCGSDGDTMLHDVVRNSYVACKWLLDHGAEVNARNTKRVTPLWHAVYNIPETIATCKLLLERGADPNLWPGKESILNHVRPWDMDLLRLLALYGANCRWTWENARKENRDRIQPYRYEEAGDLRNILTRLICAHAPISKLSDDVMRTHLFPMLG